MATASGAQSIYRRYLEITGAETRFSVAPFSIREANAASIAILRTAIRARRFALILGAGVSQDCGVPNWARLVDELIAREFPVGIRNKLRARDIPEVRKIRFLEIHKRHYRLNLRDVLYRRTSVTAKTNLYHIARYAVRLHKAKSLDRIITYNFDDLLREEISKCAPSVDIKIVSSAKQYRIERGKLHVVHPHGRIAREANDGEILNNQIVFSEFDYHRHFRDHSFWANAVQIATFSELTCLFIGTSFADPNQRRMLDLARSYGSKEPRHGAFVRLSDNAHKNALVQIDLQSFGVMPIWVREYNAIPRLLRKLLV